MLNKSTHTHIEPMQPATGSHHCSPTSASSLHSQLSRAEFLFITCTLCTHLQCDGAEADTFDKPCCRSMLQWHVLHGEINRGKGVRDCANI